MRGGPVSSDRLTTLDQKVFSTWLAASQSSAVCLAGRVFDATVRRPVSFCLQECGAREQTIAVSLAVRSHSLIGFPIMFVGTAPCCEMTILTHVLKLAAGRGRSKGLELRLAVVAGVDGLLEHPGHCSSPQRAPCTCCCSEARLAGTPG